jgi:hypothetical protein
MKVSEFSMGLLPFFRLRLSDFIRAAITCRKL